MGALDDAYSPLLDGRFRLNERVQVRGGVETWRGTDLAEGAQVAIKRLASSRVSAGVRTRLQHEARVLRGLSGTKVTPLVEARESEGSFFLVVPWLDGVTLGERLQSGPLSVSETLLIAQEVLTTLAQAHDAGVLHRDIKPSNIIVNGEGPISRAALIDFGLSRSVELEFGLRDEPVGTVEYMSPEQAGVYEREIDERSDLYSLGVVLFECLAGHAPFEGRTVSAVLREHASSPPPALPESVPHALDELVRRLLQKEPRDRYQSARGILADVERLTEAARRGIEDPALVIGLYDQRQALAEPAFVGRTQELARLETEVRNARDGSGGLVLVEAESGVGKTRLLEELEAHVRGSSRVFRGQAFAEVAQQPYQLFLGVVAGILNAAQTDQLYVAALRERLGSRAEAICSALPELSEVLGPVAQVALGPESLGETRTLDALVSLLQALGSPARPAVLLLDDAQWADEAALKLLVRFQQQSETSPAHTMIAAAFRTDEVGEGHTLRAIPRVARIALPPLASRDLRALVESMAGALPEHAVHVVEDLSRGSPFMASAVLRGMVESGALVPEGGTLRVEPTELDTVRASGQAAVFLARRLARLPPNTLRLLSVGAVLGREFNVEDAAALARASIPDAMSAITSARLRGILWTRSGGVRSVFVHDKLRETLLAGLSTQERRRLHFHAALQIEATGTARAFDIAYHFDAAGAPERALPYALAAADLARSRHSLAIAEEQYLIARRGVSSTAAGPDDVKQRMRVRVAEGLGDILMLRGRYNDAVGELEYALNSAVTRQDQARLRGKMGELSFKRGNMEDAGQHIEAGLRVLHYRALRSTLAVALGVLFEAFVQLCHVLFPRLFLARRSPAAAEDELLAIHLYSRLAHVSWFQRGRAATAWAHLKEMNLAERYPPSLLLAQAYSEHAPVMTMIPWYSRGADYARRSFAIRKSLGDVWGQGQSLHFLGVVLYAASRFEECRQNCREAVRLLERTGDRWEINTAQWHVAYCQYRLGELAAAVDSASRVYQAGVDIGDAQARGIGVTVWSKASGGAVPTALLNTELERRTTDVHTSAEILQAEAIRLLASGKTVAAADRLREADRMVQAKGLKQEYVAPITPWLATVLRHRLESLSPHDTDERRALLSESLQVSRRAVRMARAYKNNLPHALRERGLLLSMAGEARLAHHALDESLSWAERLKMRQEIALTRKARGTLGEIHGWPTAESDLAAGNAALEEMATQLQPPASADSAVTMSLVDRFSQILDAGRQIASGLSREAVYGAVRNQAMRLLRSDQCLILEMPESADAEPTPASALDHGQFSRTIVADAVRVERPVLLTEDAVATGESLVLSGARSVLCAPISVRGRIVACFYATHFRLGSLFGETEARLAEFITTLAGTALENAEGFEASAALAEQRGRLYSEAQEAIRARDEFLSIVTHELRTPLTSLGLQLSTLQRSTNQLGASAPEMQERVGRARRQFDRFQELINRLLDVSRAVEGRLMPEPEPMDLAEAAREVAERFAEELRAAKSELVLSVPEHVPGEWDRMRIDQILLNLVSNAIKFGAGKPIEVTLTTPVDRVLLRVRDHGIGIAPQDQPRIFERFERAVSTRHYGGFGLGLWITRALIQAMQGTIHVESSPGQGATFTVDLPRHPAPDQTTPVQEGSHRGYPEITSMPGHDPGRGG